MATSRQQALEGNPQGELWSKPRRLYEQDPYRADGQGRPLGFVLTGGEAFDYQAVDELVALPVANPKHMLADKSYDGDDVRSRLLMKGILPRANRKEPITCDFRA